MDRTQYVKGFIYQNVIITGNDYEEKIIFSSEKNKITFIVEIGEKNKKTVKKVIYSSNYEYNKNDSAYISNYTEKIPEKYIYFVKDVKKNIENGTDILKKYG